jgi:hypothetical protein
MTISDLLKNLDQHIKDSTQLASKFEKLPKKPGDELKNDPDALRRSRSTTSSRSGPRSGRRTRSTR